MGTGRRQEPAALLPRSYRLETTSFCCSTRTSSRASATAHSVSPSREPTERRVSCVLGSARPVRFRGLRLSSIGYAQAPLQLLGWPERSRGSCVDPEPVSLFGVRKRLPVSYREAPKFSPDGSGENGPVAPAPISGQVVLPPLSNGPPCKRFRSDCPRARVPRRASLPSKLEQSSSPVSEVLSLVAGKRARQLGKAATREVPCAWHPHSHARCNWGWACGTRRWLNFLHATAFPLFDSRRQSVARFDNRCQAVGLFGATSARSVCTDTPISAAASLANWSSRPARSRLASKRRPPSFVRSQSSASRGSF